jgi:hypothetical protein
VIGTTFYPYGNFGGEGQIRHCTIPAGMTIFGAALAFECSFDEYPQLKTLDELRSCTKQGADAISSYSVEIDGKPLNPSDIYRIESEPFDFAWGVPNIYGLNLPAGKVGTSGQRTSRSSKWQPRICSRSDLSTDNRKPGKYGFRCSKY